MRIIHLPFTNMNGVIKTKTEKGFGFITAEGQEKEIFFHSSALEGVTYDELKVGDAVTFEVEQAEKGPRATGVKKA